MFKSLAAKRHRSKPGNKPRTTSCGAGDAPVMKKGRKTEQTLAHKHAVFICNRLCGICGKSDSSPDPITP
eukprot:663979-Prorocentrum_lima.AAC.1